MIGGRRGAWTLVAIAGRFPSAAWLGTGGGARTLVAAILLGPWLSGGAAGCAREGDRVGTAPSRVVGVPGPDTAAGPVRRVGNLPFARTIVEDEAGSVAVVGDYERELGRAAGARVRVTGESRAGGLGPELRATSYEILGVDGERPYVGILASDGASYRLVGPDGGEVALETVPETFAELVGGRLWVVTDEEGAVTRYGVLLRPDEDAR